jgi:hypothetical protein
MKQQLTKLAISNGDTDSNTNSENDEQIMVQAASFPIITDSQFIVILYHIHKFLKE